MKLDDSDPRISNHASINPYRRGTGMMLSRLIWDLNVKSWVSRARLKSIKDKYKGQKAVIICNGPSLLKTNLEELAGTFTFGLNKINLLFDKSDFRPSCVVAINPYVLEQNKEFYNSTDIPLFLDLFAATNKIIKAKQNITFIHSGPEGFARDCAVSYCQGFTVTYAAMQLAFHMGFHKVALIGADHDFADKGTANKLVTATTKDRNHFDPRYFSNGMQWQLPDLIESDASYSKARDTFIAFGRSIVNATEGGKLEIFERKSLKRFLSD